MRVVAMVIILLVAVPLQSVASAGEARAESPAPLPDLKALAIDFSFFGSAVEIVEAKLGQMYPLTVSIFITNAGPGNSTGANLSVYQDGNLLAIVPVGTRLNATGPENMTRAIYMWNISGVPPGRHVFRAEAMDPAGDSNASDNGVERSLLFLESRPEFSLSLSPSLLVADVTPSLPATVEFSGEVRTEIVDGLEPAVELEASTDIGWKTRITYGQGFSGNATVKPFKVNVTVPERTSGLASGLVVVTGRLGVGGLTWMEQAHARVNVSAYFCASVECERPHQTIQPGGIEIFEYFITNNGNTFDSYSLKISNREELEARGWALYLSKAELHKLIPKGRALVLVRATSPNDWSVYRDETAVIELNVTPMNGSENSVFYSEELPATVRVRGYNTPGVALLSSSIVVIVAVSLAAFLVMRRRRRR